MKDQGARTGQASRLLAAAKAVLLEDGLRSLTLRKVARKAGVNLAMYHYYFRSKQGLLQGLLRELVKGLRSDIQAAEAIEGPCLARLRASLLAHAASFRTHYALTGAVLAAARQGDRIALRLLVEEALPRSLPMSVHLMQECQAQGLLRPLRPETVMPMLMAGVMGPRFFTEAIAKAMPLARARRRFGLPLPEGEPTDADLEACVDLLLRGLATPKGRRQLEALGRKASRRK